MRDARVVAFAVLLGTTACFDTGGPAYGPVEVQVYEYGSPAFFATVLFHEYDGTFHSIETTDANGHVSVASAPAGGMVTALFDGFDCELETLTHIPIGGTIVIGALEEDGEYLGLYDVSWSAYPGAAEYEVSDSCDAWTTTATSETGWIWSDCASATGTFDVAVVARDAAGIPLAYAYRLDQSVEDLVSMPAWQTNWTAHEVVVDDPALAYGTVWFSSVIDGAPMGSQEALLADAETRFAFRRIPDHAQAKFLTYLLRWEPQGGSLLYESKKGALPAVASYGPGEFLPIPVATLGAIDPARPMLSWTWSGPAVDSVMVTFDYEGDGTSWNSWQITRRSSDRSFRIPELPDTLASCRPNGAWTRSYVMMADLSDGAPLSSNWNWEEIGNFTIRAAAGFAE